NSAPSARYLVALGLVAVFAVIAKNLVRGRIGRSWMAIRDRDIAAEIIGVRPLRTKLLAFGISSFYCGVAGAGLVFRYLGSAETGGRTGRKLSELLAGQARAQRVPAEAPSRQEFVPARLYAPRAHAALRILLAGGSLE